MRPAAHLLSFASPKERRQRKSDPQSATPIARWAKGATCDARSWGGVAELAAFGRRPNYAQTTATSQITKCVCPAAHAPTPRPALLGAASRGGERAPHGPWLRSARVASLRFGLVGSGGGESFRDQAWIYGALVNPQPFGSGSATAPTLWAARSASPTPGAAAQAAAGWYSPPAGCAEKRRAGGGRVCRRTHTLRDLARRRCLSGAGPTAPRSEFCDATPGPSIAGCPRSPDRANGGRRLGVAFSLVTFSWRSKRKLLRRRAHTPASALKAATEVTMAPGQ